MRLRKGRSMRGWFKWWLWNKWNFKYYEIKSGIRNLYHYRKVIWNVSDADYSSILMVIEATSRDIANHLNKHNIRVDSHKRAKELTIVACLCKRLREDDYFSVKHYFNDSNKTKFNYHKYMYNQDLELLRYILRKLPFWWC